MFISETDFKTINLSRSLQELTDIVEGLARDGFVEILDDEQHAYELEQAAEQAALAAAFAADEEAPENENVSDGSEPIGPEYV